MRIPLTLATALVLLSCGDGDEEAAPPRAAPTPVEDSVPASVSAISVDPLAVAEWTLADAPAVTIDSESAPFFGDLPDAALTADAGIFLVDPKADRVHWYDGTGAWLRSFGQAGNGPGEFVSISAISLAPGDSLLVYDSGLSRLSIFHTTSGFARSVSFANEAGTGSPPAAVWALGPTRLVAFGSRPTAEEAPPGETPVRVQRTAVVTVHDRRGRPLAAPYELTGSYSAVAEVLGELTLPFANIPFVAAGMDRVVVGSGERYDVTVLSPTLEPLRDIRWPALERPLTVEEIGRVREQLRTFWSDYPEQVVVLVEEVALSPELLPRIRPAISAAKLDAQGRLWLQDFEPRVPGAVSGPTRWRILSPEGMPVGTLELPPETHLGAVGDDQVLVVTRDSLDVRHISVHRLIGPVGGA